MAHRIFFNYGTSGISENFNQINHDVLFPGILSNSLTLTKVNNTTVEIPTFVALIKTNIIPMTVRIEADATEDITVSNTTPLIVIRFDWENNILNDFDILAIADGDEEANDIIIGLCNFSGATLVDFDYTNQQVNPLMNCDIHNLNETALTEFQPSDEFSFLNSLNGFKGEKINFEELQKNFFKINNIYVETTTPDDTDLLLLNYFSSSWLPSKIQASNLKNYFLKFYPFTSITQKINPSLTDKLLISDVDDSDNPKYIEVQDLFPSISVSSDNQNFFMNSNFQIWQFGTSFTNPANGSITADRIKVEYVYSGTLPTSIQHSRRTSDPLYKNHRSYDILPNSAGTGLATNDYYKLSHSILNGNSILSGTGEKVTVSFYAKAATAGKKLGISLNQNYGTGGSPSTEEIINGTYFVLTTTLTKYTYTFTLNTKSGKTFGLNIDDYLKVNFYIVWGLNKGTEVGDTSAEHFMSSRVTFTQVQVNAGEESLLYNPPSYETELQRCKFFGERINSDITNHIFGIGGNPSNLTSKINLFYSKKRTIPTITSSSSSTFALRDIEDNINTLSLTPAISDISTQSAKVLCTTATEMIGSTSELVSTGTSSYFDIKADL